VSWERRERDKKRRSPNAKKMQMMLLKVVPVEPRT